MFLLVVKRLTNEQFKAVNPISSRRKYLSKYFQKILSQNCSVKKYILKNVFKKLLPQKKKKKKFKTLPPKIAPSKYTFLKILS